MSLRLVILEPFPDGIWPYFVEAERAWAKVSRAKGVAMNRVKARPLAVWALIASALLLAGANPSAYGFEFPATSSLTLSDETAIGVLQAPAATAAALYSQFTLASNTSGSIFSTELALVSSLSRQVEMARTPIGAKKVAKAILAEKYGLGGAQYSCLNKLWTKESNWNYKARNKISGAHGIPQALPAKKMDVIATDWRTNPVTQIRWGLRYISIRYETPCAAWAKFRSHNMY